MSQSKENFKKSLSYFQKIMKASGPVAAASYGLIGSIVLLSFLGYFLDKWFETAPWLMMAGMVMGVISGFYEISKVIWRK